jgi:hypothetical protein
MEFVPSHFKAAHCLDGQRPEKFKNGLLTERSEEPSSTRQGNFRSQFASTLPVLEGLSNTISGKKE